MILQKWKYRYPYKKMKGKVNGNKKLILNEIVKNFETKSKNDINHFGLIFLNFVFH